MLYKVIEIIVILVIFDDSKENVNNLVKIKKISEFSLKLKPNLKFVELTTILIIVIKKKKQIN